MTDRITFTGTAKTELREVGTYLSNIKSDKLSKKDQEFFGRAMEHLIIAGVSVDKALALQTATDEEIEARVDLNDISIGEFYGKWQFRIKSFTKEEWLDAFRVGTNILAHCNEKFRHMVLYGRDVDSER